MVIQRLCLLLCIYLLLLSCNNTERQLSLQKNIIGDWITATETPQSKNVKHIIDIEGLIFYNDSLPNKSFYYVGHNNTLGYTSQYKIKNDSLFLLDRADKYWKGYKLVKLTADTLKLEQFGVSTSLIRIKKIKKLRSFDKIILSTSGCYGTCPILNISINPNGEVLFNGEEYTLKRGLQKGTLSKEI